MIPDIPDVFALIGFALSILFAPIYYGRTTTTKEDSK